MLRMLDLAVNKIKMIKQYQKKSVKMNSSKPTEVDIKLYGTSSYSYEYVKNALQEYCHGKNVDCFIQEYHDLESIVQLNVDRIPAVKINGSLFQMNSERIQSFINKLINKIEMDLSQNEFKLYIAADFSPPSYNAVDYALKIAPSLAKELSLVHAYFPGADAINSKIVVSEELSRIRRDQLASVLADAKSNIEDSNPTSIKSKFQMGFPADVLVNLSEGEDNPMIIMGSKGAGDIITDVFGSVSRKVARHAKCPVWIIPPTAKYKKVKNILYASNNIESDVEAIPKIKALANRFGAELHVIHVSNNSSYHLPSLLKDYMLHNNIIYKEIENLGLEDAILQYAIQEHVDIISFSNKPLKVSEKLFHKSFTRMMYNKSHLPLLVIH